MNDLENIPEIGDTTAGYAAQTCETCALLLLDATATSQLTPIVRRAGCAVFGRDEGGSEFSFSAQQVAAL